MQKKLIEVKIQMSTQTLHDESRLKIDKDNTKVSKSTQSINEKSSPALTLFKKDVCNQQLGDAASNVNHSHPNIFNNKAKLHFTNTKKK